MACPSAAQDILHRADRFLIAAQSVMFMFLRIKTELRAVKLSALSLEGKSVPR
jgi:hypothetical protein